jgi:hypothetical protein
LRLRLIAPPHLAACDAFEALRTIRVRNLFNAFQLKEVLRDY